MIKYGLGSLQKHYPMLRKGVEWMKSKNNKAVLIVAISVIMTLLLTGCDLFMTLNITDEQQELVAEYAAGLLRKYDKNGVSLKDPAKEEAEEEAETEEAETADSDTSEPGVSEPETSEPEADSETPSDIGTEEVDPAIFNEDETAIGDAPSYEDISAMGSTLGNAVGYPQVDMSYTGYEVCDRYPDQEDNSWLVSMSASEGNKLIVVHVNIANNSGEEQECDILNAGKSYRLLINDSIRVNESISVMMDAFGQYSCSMAPGQSDDTVLIFETSEDNTADIGTLSLVVRDSSGSESIGLQ